MSGPISPTQPRPQLIIRTVGQSGADLAALDWAIANGFPHTGWCPRGRRSETGSIDARYRLTETPSGDYSQRTEWNVRDSDATVIFSISSELAGGSFFTQKCARKHRKPCLHLAAERAGENHAALLRAFIEEHAVKVLNVAGPRPSKQPEVGRFVQELLTAAT